MQGASLRTQRGGAVGSSPAQVALALGGGLVTAPVTPAGSRAHRERVGGIEAQEVVVGITEEVEQHL